MSELVLSVHMTKGGPLRSGPSPDSVAGLRYVEAMTPADLGHRLPKPKVGRRGLICAWDDDRSLDAFLAEDGDGRRIATGWHVRLQPLRASGSWARLPELEQAADAGDDGEPVAVVTLGRLRPSQGPRFLRTTYPAEKALLGAPGLLASSGMARPPLFCTFSLWRSAAEMRDYAYGAGNEQHAAAIKAHRDKSFHKESIFARFRPYRSEGSWNGSDPLAAVELPERRPTPV